MDYDALLDEAADIAERASQIALSYFRQAILIENKPDLTPVTIADKKTEEMIRGEIAKAFPHHGIRGEEFGVEGEDAEFVWTIDPIDGTRSFIRGIPLFGTLLGLLEKGEPVLGIMVLPALGETYIAGKDLGTFCNGTQLHVSAMSTLEKAFVSCGDLNCWEASGKRGFLEKLQHTAEVVRGYTDCFGHSLVLRGSLDAMVDPIVSLWDVAPLACLVKEAGGTYCTFDGEETHTGQSFISCTPGIKKQLLELGR